VRDGAAVPRRILVLGGWPESLINFRGPLLQSMTARGHEVVAAAGGDDPSLRARLADRGVRYHPMRLERAGLNPLADLGSLVQVRRILRRERIDLVLAYTIKPVVYGLLAARSLRIRDRYALITGAGYAFGDGSVRRRVVGRVARGLYRAALDGARGVIFQNRDDRVLFQAKKLIRPRTPTRVVAGSGVDLERFPQVPPPPGPPIFLMIARLLRDKGVFEFCEAARIVRRVEPAARFQLLGPLDPSPDGIALSDLADWLDDGTVEYLGERADVTPHLAASWVYVLPSYREGMPRTVLEAMATGRPVVTTDVPGCRDTTIDGENGFLVPPRDSAALARAALRVLNGADRTRMGRRSRQLVEERFDVRHVNREILEMLDL